MVESDAADPSLTISFRKGDTTAPACSDLPDELYAQFMTPTSPGRPYGRYQAACSILALPATYSEYIASPELSKVRYAVGRARREGYAFQEIEPEAWRDDILAVNASLDERQGRPMDAAYLTEPIPPRERAAGCPRHREVWYGIVKDGRLVAYAWIFQVGEMCLFSRILGHGAHMDLGIMYQLVAGVIEGHMSSSDLRYPMYERHTSGTEGLQFFKRRMGFRSCWVDWQLADEPVISRRPAYEAAIRRAPDRPGPVRRIARRLRRFARSRLGG